MVFVVVDGGGGGGGVVVDCVGGGGCGGNLGGVVLAWSFVRSRFTALKGRCVGFPCLV